MKDKTVLQLATRINEISKEKNNLELKLMELEAEYNAIVYELWERIPNLKDDIDMQPKKRTKEKK